MRVFGDLGGVGGIWVAREHLVNLVLVVGEAFGNDDCKGALLGGTEKEALDCDRVTHGENDFVGVDMFKCRGGDEVVGGAEFIENLTDTFHNPGLDVF